MGVKKKALFEEYSHFLISPSDAQLPNAFAHTAEEIREAFDAVEPELIRILEKAAANIRKFHQSQVRNSFLINDSDGVVMGQKVIPMDRVGIYVPGGTAAYPSTVLMDSIPAKYREDVKMIYTDFLKP